MIRVEYHVSGMGCDACVRRVKNAITALSGVTKCEVNLTKETASVDYDEDTVSEADIREAAEEAGYSLTKLS